MNFGQALELLKQGKGLKRIYWKNTSFVKLQKGYPDGIKCNKQTADTWGIHEGDLFRCNPYFQVKNSDGSYSMWTPSLDDILADDWEMHLTNEEKMKSLQEEFYKMEAEYYAVSNTHLSNPKGIVGLQGILDENMQEKPYDPFDTARYEQPPTCGCKECDWSCLGQ